MARPTNRYYTPFWGLLLYGILTVSLVLTAQADEQTLVLFYAVSVFLSFLAGSSHGRVLVPGERTALALNVVGALVVAFILVMNLARVTPLASLAATLFIALGLYGMWVRNERPRGIARAEE